MPKLTLPEKIRIQIVDYKEKPFKIEKVLVYIHLFAKYKNDFYLGPYYSDINGIISINKDDLNFEIQAKYSTGLMDYSGVQNCFPMIEIRPYTTDELKKLINTRKKVWNILLEGEDNRWENINQLISFCKTASNFQMKFPSSFLRDEWVGKNKSYSYKLIIDLK